MLERFIQYAISGYVVSCCDVHRVLNLFLRNPVLCHIDKISNQIHELRRASHGLTSTHQWQFIITGYIARNLHHVLQFTDSLFFSFFPSTPSLFLYLPIYLFFAPSAKPVSFQCPSAWRPRISANPLITLLSDAWHNDVASARNRDV